MLADVIEAAEFEGGHDESGCVGLQGDRQRAGVQVVNVRSSGIVTIVSKHRLSCWFGRRWCSGYKSVSKGVSGSLRRMK